MSTSKIFDKVAILLICLALVFSIAIALMWVPIDSSSMMTVSANDLAKITEYINLDEQEGDVSIFTGGTYYLSGTLEEGRVLVNIDSTEYAILILAGVDISCSYDSAIYVANSGNCALYLAEGTENTVSSGTECEIRRGNTSSEANGGAICFKDNATICGEGSLTVYGYLNNGIHGSNDLFIEEGTITVTAINNGIKGKDNLVIDGGNITITAGNAGLKSGASGDSDSGNLKINGGYINILQSYEGMEATQITINDGETYIVASDDGINACGGSGIFNGGFGGMGQMDFGGDIQAGNKQRKTKEGSFDPNSSENSSENSEDRPEIPSENQVEMFTEGDMQVIPDGTSNGGIEFDQNMQMGFDGNMPDNSSENFSENSGDMMQGGMSGAHQPHSTDNFEENSSNESINTPVNPDDESVTSSEDTGEQSFSTPPEKPDENQNVEQEDIPQLPEGMTEEDMRQEVINNGEMFSGDNGNMPTMPSEGGMQMSDNVDFENFEFGEIAEDSDNDSSAPSLTINGGYVYILAGGDGLDSNGDLIINGGTVIVDGPSDSANGALDSGSENGGQLLVNGGTLIAVGTSGMAEVPEDESSQNVFSYNASFSAGDKICISDSEGNIIFEYNAAKSGNSIVFSSPELTIGETYTLSVGDASYEIELTDVITGSTSGGFGGGMPSGGGGFSNMFNRGGKEK